MVFLGHALQNQLFGLTEHGGPIGLGFVRFAKGVDTLLDAALRLERAERHRELGGLQFGELGLQHRRLGVPRARDGGREYPGPNALHRIDSFVVADADSSARRAWAWITRNS